MTPPPSLVCVCTLEDVFGSCVVIVSFIGCEGSGDPLGPEWDPLHRRSAGPLPSVCTAGLLPALQS